MIHTHFQHNLIHVSQAADFARALTSARSMHSIVYDRASGGAEHCQTVHAPHREGLRRSGAAV
ncbi:MULTISPECIES: hypothetical protein [unclassified Variovorax]|uniref:hypothetical protein n=1 Tax=unclassified Variovorax TaxID=663243 RepID=UPI000A5DC2BB|nr:MULTISPECIES: hypothetical protein [unclassified Variovorax]